MSTGSEKIITLPERETFLANSILSTLREWKRRNDTTRGRVWIVTSEDLDYLESWAANLWEKWKDTRDSFERNGFEVVEQPSIVSGKR